MQTNHQPKKYRSAIIYRASTSILRDTTPKFSREDQHALKLLAEYGL